jgi:hypothetical protein
MRRNATIHVGLLASSVLAAGFFAASGAHADIWKWVDAQGRVQYSDRWTPGAVLIKGEHTHAADLSGPSDDSARPNASQPDATDQRITDRLNREEAQRAVKRDEEAARAKQCKEAQDHYQQVIHARRIYREEKNGERQYLSDADADKARVQARLDVQSACGTNVSPNAS